MSSANTKEAPAGDRAVTVLKELDKVDTACEDRSSITSYRSRLPRPSNERFDESLLERPFDLETRAENELPHELSGGLEKPKTVFYLAYGSNLCYETFQGRRGIRPISQVNVVVPELVMTFDLAGLPYAEPCFANTAFRNPADAPPLQSPPSNPDSEETFLLPTFTPTPQYHNPHWPKGLVGVVYEVNLTDYAHIIATEGGGSSYHDILITCHELPPTITTIPEHPTTPPFKAHTLYSPLPAPGSKPKLGQRVTRPDPNYAQPSARYLKLIRDGADEHDIPQEYKNYLHELTPYTITTRRQRLGAQVFTGFWRPIIGVVFRLNARFADKRGRAPRWLMVLTATIFGGIWASYDVGFKKVFGEGERTVGV